MHWCLKELKGLILLNRLQNVAFVLLKPLKTLHPLHVFYAEAIILAETFSTISIFNRENGRIVYEPFKRISKKKRQRIEHKHIYCLLFCTQRDLQLIMGQIPIFLLQCRTGANKRKFLLRMELKEGHLIYMEKFRIFKCFRNEKVSPYLLYMEKSKIFMEDFMRNFYAHMVFVLMPK